MKGSDVMSLLSLLSALSFLIRARMEERPKCPCTDVVPISVLLSVVPFHRNPGLGTYLLYLTIISFFSFV